MITRHTANVLARCFYGMPMRGVVDGRALTGRQNAMNSAVKNGLIHDDRLTATGIAVLQEYCTWCRR